MTIPSDKLKHFAVNFALTAICGTYGAAFAAGASLGKEYGDKNAVGNKWCWWDLLADGIGIVAGYAVNRLLIYPLLYHNFII